MEFYKVQSLKIFVILLTLSYRISNDDILTVLKFYRCNYGIQASKLSIVLLLYLYFIHDILTILKLYKLSFNGV